MKILNFGSLNIDHVYQVDHFVQPGETLSSSSYQQFCGGKGSNQSIALALAGARVSHAGKLGKDGNWLKEFLASCGADVTFVKLSDEASGHAIIQVNKEGENSIILHGGANQEITSKDIEEAISACKTGDLLLLQNEINAIPEIMEQGAKQGLQIVLNPAPMTQAVLDYPINLVKYFILNEIEGEQFTEETEPELILDRMLEKFPEAAIVLTLGSKGVSYADSATRISIPAEKVDPVDTTAAGDTFIGYFLAEIAEGKEIKTALETACRAAAISVTRMGAASSIPRRKEVS